MSKLLDALNGKSLQDVQNTRKAARDSTGSPPETTPPTLPERTRGDAQPEDQEPSFPASQLPTHPDGLEAGNSATQPAGKTRSRKAGRETGIRALNDQLMTERQQVTKLTLDVAPDTRDRLNRAVQHFGRGAQRKIVEYALDAALAELGY